MGWVDDALEHLEQICPNDLKPAVETLRQGWDFVVGYYPDPAVLRSQRDNLSDLRDRGQQLLSQYTDSVLKLQQTWQGDLAAKYLPPQVTGFQIEHDMEPTDNSFSTQLSNNLLVLVRSLDHNQGTHNHWADQFEGMRSKQNDARGTIIAVAAINVGTDWIPIWGEIDLPASITAAAAIIGDILAAVREFINTYKVLIIIGVVAIGVGITFDELVLPQLWHSSSISTTGDGSGANSLTPDQIKELAEALGVDESVVQQWANMGLSEAEMLIAAILLTTYGISAYHAGRLAQRGLQPGISQAVLEQIAGLLQQLCNITGLSDFIINTIESNGINPQDPTPALRQLLYDDNTPLGRLWRLITGARGSDLGDQRVLGVLEQLAKDGELGGLQDASLNFTTATGSSDADIVINGKIIQVGGAFKSSRSARLFGPVEAIITKGWPRKRRC